MSFAAYIGNIYTQLGLACLLATSLFAWTKGGKAERAGTLMLLVVWIGADIARGLTGELMPTAVLTLSDVLISTCFLYLAVRYSSLWLGLAMLFRSFGFALHAIQLSDADAPRWHGMIIYLLLNNILSYLVLATLAGGTLATMTQRMRARKERARAEAKACGRTNRPATVPPQPLVSSL
jgi:hypothetical protein